MNKIRIAVFASGSGTNAENFFKFFKDSENIEIALLACNKKDAYVLNRANNHNIPTLVFGRKDFYESDKTINELINKKIDYIVLAGFLWLIPKNLIEVFPDRIINIHPALLPKYGGKGMYGMKVHEAVKTSREKESGITIHLVNEKYDEGRTLFQQSISVTPEDTPEDIANKVHNLEYEFFPSVTEEYILNRIY